MEFKVKEVGSIEEKSLSQKEEEILEQNEVTEEAPQEESVQEVELTDGNCLCMWRMNGVEMQIALLAFRFGIF